MVHSMTGYGKAERKNKNYIFSVEIKSLNSRYFDIISKIDDRFFSWSKVWIVNVGLQDVDIKTRFNTFKIVC